MSTVNNDLVDSDISFNFYDSDSDADSNSIDIVHGNDLPFLNEDPTEAFFQNPISTYHNLRSRRVAYGFNFPFPEVAQNLKTVAAFLKNLAESATDSEISEDTQIPTYLAAHARTFSKEIESLGALNFPYYASLLALFQCLENLHYSYYEMGKYKNLSSNDEVSYPPDITDIWTQFFSKIRRDPSFIAFPTMHELAPGYFPAIHSVRAYPLGVSLQPITYADYRRYSPVHFIVHDMQHAVMIELAFSRIKEISINFNEQEISQRLQENYTIIKRELDNSGIKEIWESAELLLFYMFHEIGSIKANPDDLKAKLEGKVLVEKIRRLIENNFFGEGYSRLLPYLEQAHTDLVQVTRSGLLLEFN